ncbi:MAG: hypothetical protein M4579_000001 [Chaenotheca gracillima]|nr:MAG: hypothetical protein M4579_000001 [Chaenotheca gracillima]
MLLFRQHARVFTPAAAAVNAAAFRTRPRHYTTSQTRPLKLLKASRLPTQPRRTVTTNPNNLEASDVRVEGTISEGREGASQDASAAAGAALEPPEYLSETERSIFDKLKAELAPATLEVQDISGGCGSMFAIDVASTKFEGMTMIKQHRLVNEILRSEIGGWHGLQLKTRAAPAKGEGR